MRVYFITITLASIAAFVAQATKQPAGSNHPPISNPLQKISVNSLFVFLVFLILFLVAGLRWRVGTDYWQYAISYLQYSRTSAAGFFRFGQAGIRAISVLSRHIHDDYATMFCLASLVTIGLYVRHIAKTSNMFLLSILLFIFTGAWHGTFNGVRQHLAAAMIFAGSGFIIREKFYQYAFVVGLASLFHPSALVMLPVYFIARRRVDYRQWFVLLVIAGIMIVSYDLIFRFSEIILGKEIAMLPYMTRRVNLLRVAVACAPVMLYFLLEKWYEHSHEASFYVNMLFINAVLVIATFNSAYLMRVAIYTSIYTTIALPKLVACFDEKSAVSARFAIIGLYSLFWYVEVSNAPALVPFRWIFER